MATVTRESIHQMAELVDEAKQWLQLARTASDDENRKKRLELAERSLRQVENMIVGRET